MRRSYKTESSNATQTSSQSGSGRRNKMHDNPPGFLDMLRAAVDAHGLSALLAFALSYMRVLYDDKEPRPVRQLIEALLGGMIVLLVGLSCDELGVSRGWSYVAAGIVGTLGVNWVRTMARAWAKKKVDG